MNLRIVLHLFKTDWQRLQRPLIGLWIIIFLTALPWWLSDPLGFSLPACWDAGGSGNWIDAQRERLYSNPWVREPLIWSNLARVFLALGIATAIGVGGQTAMMIQPVRRRERLAAATLTIILLLVLPQGLVLASNLFIHRFSPGVVAAAALDHSLSATLVFGMAALFGAWCRGFWYCLAGLAGLATAAGLVNLFATTPIALSQLVVGNPWGYPNGWKTCTFALAAIVLLGSLLPWARSGRGQAARITVAVVLLTLAAFAGTFAGNAPRAKFTEITGSSAGIDTAAIRPVLGRAWLDSDTRPWWSDSDNPVLISGISGKIGTAACPPGHAVEWKPTGKGVLTQQGKPVVRLAASREPAETYREAERSAGYFFPRDHIDAPAIAALPGKNAPLANRFLETNSRFQSLLRLGDLLEPGLETLDANHPATLTLELTGTVYRYEAIVDVPLADSPAEVKTGNVTWRARRFPSEPGDLRADLVVSHPAIGFASEPEEIRWDAAPPTQCLFYFHFPKNDANIRVESSFYADGPLLAGAGWHRRILGIDGQSLANFNLNLELEGARLIVLKPVVVARIPAVEASVVLSATDDADIYYDFSLNSRYGSDPRIYQEKLITDRPDPRTCSRKEFGRWLRIPAAVFPWESGSLKDLASYAPRFTDVMVKVARKETVQEALRRGVPESKRRHLLDAIATEPLPGNLIEVAVRRGWADEVKDAILMRFNSGDSLRINSVMYLEDPSTYPALLEILMQFPELQTYEKIRLLPGIEPLLEQAVAEALRSTSLPRLLAAAPRYDNRLPYGPYLIAAKRGNIVALDAVLAILKAGGSEGSSFYHTRSLDQIFVAPPLSGHVNQKWLDHLGGKTAADFQYDPLARIWRLR
jgi:hypothetical protein